MYPDGPPQDVIVQLHFYCTKEHLLQAKRDNSSMEFQEHVYQLFSYLSPAAIVKYREFRPIVKILQAHGIHYRWGVSL